MLKEEQYSFDLFYPQPYCYFVLPFQTMETLPYQAD